MPSRDYSGKGGTTEGRCRKSERAKTSEENEKRPGLRTGAPFLHISDTILGLLLTTILLLLAGRFARRLLGRALFRSRRFLGCVLH